MTELPDKLVKLIAELESQLGDGGVLTGADVTGRAAGIWRKDTVAAPIIFRPRSTEEVAAVLRACHAAGQPVVTHGGLTGLVEGAIASPAEVVLSTERMDTIEACDVANRTMQVQAGVKLQLAQEHAADNGLLLPLDLGARGSCTLGGNAATNAGGHRVVRYGMTRDNVLGLEAVLADGTVVSSMNSMLKNNAGYDLKQLFIGTEGTLGIITRLVLRLRPAWQSQETALLACESFEDVMRLLNYFDAALGGTLSAFELMWQDFYELAIADVAPPLAAGAPYYVLVEALGADAATDADRFVQVVETAFANGLLRDAVICKSGAERDAMWKLRDSVEKTLEFGPAYIFDVSLPLPVMESYVTEVQQQLDRSCAGHRTWVFGHAGDGNLHLVVADTENRGREVIERSVYEPLRGVGGSISGEHGIGLEKRRWLPVTRSGAEIEVMRKLKVALDPTGILNPGRVTGGSTI